MALLLLTGGLFAAAAVASPASCCSKAPYKALLPLSKNCFVQQFCTKNFPVPAVTSTTATSFITSTVTATTTTTLSTTLTPTVVVHTTDTTTLTTTLSTTQTDSTTSTTTVTTVRTSTVGTSTTTVVTDASGNFRREAQFTPALEARAVPVDIHGYSRNKRAQAASAEFAAFTKNSVIKSALSTVCSCIETPATILVKATSTTTSTSTSTVSTTLSFTSPTTTTSPLTETQTATATTTLTTTTTQLATATATSVVNVNGSVRLNVCGQTIRVPSNTPLGVRCGNKVGNVSFQTLGSDKAGSYYECLFRADNVFSSTSFAYQFSTGTCFIYAMSSSADNAAFVADPDFVYSYFFP